MYIDAFYEREKNQILVVERDKNHKRRFTEYPSKYVAYWTGGRGKVPNIYGQMCDKFSSTKIKEFTREINVLPKDKLHETDINPIFRCLYENYKDVAPPPLHVGFFDIEVSFDPERGFSSPEDAFSPITAISLFLNWLNRNFTMVIKPDGMSFETAQEIVDKFEDTILCESEKELLEIFLSLIDDVDILTGWNSEGFDIPYIHNRIVQVLGREETRKLCLWGKFPKRREYEMYGKNMVTFDLIGKIHMDYLQLYRKNTYHEMHSYRLDFVGEYEVGEKKIHYEGSLDSLYNNDFEKFIEYNRQDVMLLVKIDAKNKFIELSNNLAHENCVLFQNTLGSVGLIDQAIVNECWNLGFVVPNRKRDNYHDDTEEESDEDEINISGVVGAYVADPKEGMHDWIGGVDINSLYPSAIRALNMSPETIIGHIRPEATDKLIMKRMRDEKKSFADAWGGMFGTLEYNWVMNREMNPVTVDFEDGSTVTVSASELYDLVFKSNKRMMLSANGTIFTGDKKGIIPGLLARWYAERKELQAEMKKYAKMADEETDPEKKADYKKLTEFYDQRQLIKKILLNSLYGAIGNPGSRFYDPRVAQSTTLSGRCIVKHMGSKINEVITGDYNHTGLACIYGDTDSVAKDSIIDTSVGNRSVEDLFYSGSIFWQEGDKEYSRNDSIQVMGYNQKTNETTMTSYNYVYRHKVSKKRFKITTSSGKCVIVTEDHSIMVMDDGKLIEKKPSDLTKNDIIITGLQTMVGRLDTLESVEELEPFNDEYVYDVGINPEQPWFFANSILVHNSIYFSAYPVMKDLPEFQDFDWSKENVTDLYDKIGDITNQSFPEFMQQAFNCTPENGAIIRAARELCAIKGLFITKKRYAVLIYDKEGKRKDVNGKRGEIKAMGLDLKRSDTSKFISDFLSLVLTDVLSDVSREDIFGKIQDFRKQFSLQPSWEKGSPKRVNNLTKYANIKKTQETGDVFSKNSDKKKTIPGHVVASLNYNKLKSIFNDNESMTIQDGFKIIVCKLKPNNRFGMNSVAYPVDLIHIPDWFKQLPFDDTLMEETSIDRKLENLLGVLKWDLAKTKSENQAFSDLFEF